MGKYHKVLVAVDGSAPSLHALEEAFRLVTNWIVVVAVAPKYEGDLRLVGVRDVAGLLQEPCRTALAQAQKLADAAGAFIKTVCAIGEPHERLVDQAEGENCDLIVMGPKGHSFIERALLGSVTRRVIGYSRIDVLVVPPQAAVGWGKILLAFDGSQSSRRAAERAFDLAQAYGGELTAVTAVDLPPMVSEAVPGIAPGLGPETHLLDEIKAAAQSRGLKIDTQVRLGTPYLNITDLARGLKTDLIIMGSHGHTGLKRLLMGSVTERTIGHAPCPVLVVRG